MQNIISLYSTHSFQIMASRYGQHYAEFNWLLLWLVLGVLVAVILLIAGAAVEAFYKNRYLPKALGRFAEQHNGRVYWQRVNTDYTAENLEHAGL